MDYVPLITDARWGLISIVPPTPPSLPSQSEPVTSEPARLPSDTPPPSDTSPPSDIHTPSEISPTSDIIPNITSSRRKTLVRGIGH